MTAARTVMVVVIAAMLTVAGCIAIPFPVVPEEDEFSDENLAFILPDESSRDDIIGRLGYPQIVRQEGQLVVYAQARTVAGLLIGTMGSASMGPIETYSSLIIEYDQSGTVKAADVIRGRDNCSKNGSYCIDSQFHAQYTAGFVFDFESVVDTTIVYTTGERDAVAKRYEPLSSGCRVYVYKSGRETMIKVYVSGQGSSLLGDRGYLYWSVAPGNFTVYATEQGEPVYRSFECLAPQPVFVNIYVDKQRNDPPILLSSETTATGKQRVGERMLILD